MEHGPKVIVREEAYKDLSGLLGAFFEKSIHGIGDRVLAQIKVVEPAQRIPKNLNGERPVLRPEEREARLNAHARVFVSKKPPGAFPSRSRVDPAECVQGMLERKTARLSPIDEAKHERRHVLIVAINPTRHVLAQIGPPVPAVYGFTEVFDGTSPHRAKGPHRAETKAAFAPAGGSAKGFGLEDSVSRTPASRRGKVSAAHHMQRAA